jgi:mannosyltransferase
MCGRLAIKRRSLYIGLLITLASLHFIERGHVSLWFDELFSLFWSKAGPSFILAHITDETNPPLYYLLLSGWISVLGDSETVVRLPSAIASAITIPLLYVLGRHLFDECVGVIASFLYGMSYWQIVFAHEARAYALLNLLLVLMLWCLHRLVIELRRGTPAVRTAISIPSFSLVLGTVIAAYLHYVTFCIILSLSIALAAIWWRDFAFCRRFLTCFTLIGAAIAVLTGPSLALALLDPNPTNLGFPGFPSIKHVTTVALGVPRWGIPSNQRHDYIYNVASLAYKIASIVFGASWLALLVHGARSHNKRPAFSLTFVFPVVGFIVLVLASTYRPVFLLPRTALWLAVPVYLGVAGGVSALSCLKLKRAVTALLFLSCALFTLGYWILPQKEPWRAWVADIASKVSRGDLVILGNDTPATAFVYYEGRSVLPLLRRWPADVTAGDKLDAYVTGIRPVEDDEIITVRDRGNKILLLTRSCDLPKWIELKNILFSYCGLSSLTDNAEIE